MILLVHLAVYLNYQSLTNIIHITMTGKNRSKLSKAFNFLTIQLCMLLSELSML